MNSQEKQKLNQYIQTGAAADQDEIADLFISPGNEFDLDQMAYGNWESTGSEKVDLQHVLNKIHFDMNTGLAGKKETFAHWFLQSYSKVAAILLLPLLLVSAFILYTHFTTDVSIAEIRAPKGSRVQFTLPDGSVGYLNGGSSIKYATDFDEERLVALSGEGFFEVKKDEKHPFTVQTDVANIQVLGTRFDVCAYSTDPEIVTTLEEGAVKIWGKNSSVSALLKPGQQNKYDRETGKMRTLNVKTDLFTSWKDETLRFDNASFADVVKKMERWYGVRILLDPEMQNTERYTMTIRTESLREMMGLLSITMPLSYSIKKDTVYINGTKPIRRN